MGNERRCFCWTVVGRRRHFILFKLLIELHHTFRLDFSMPPRKGRRVGSRKADPSRLVSDLAGCVPGSEVATKSELVSTQESETMKSPCVEAAEDTLQAINRDDIVSSSDDIVITLPSNDIVVTDDIDIALALPKDDNYITQSTNESISAECVGNTTALESENKSLDDKLEVIETYSSIAPLPRRTSYCDPVETIYSSEPNDTDLEFEATNPLSKRECGVLLNSSFQLSKPAASDGSSSSTVKHEEIPYNSTLPRISFITRLLQVCSVLISFNCKLASLAIYLIIAGLEFGLWVSFKFLTIPYLVFCMNCHIAMTALSLGYQFTKSIVLSLSTILFSFALVILNNTPGSSCRIPKVLNGHKEQ